MISSLSTDITWYILAYVFIARFKSEFSVYLVDVFQKLEEHWFLSCCLVQDIYTYILEETDCISHSTNTLGKGMNPIILIPAMGK